MKLLYKLLKQKPDTREGITITTSALGILVNTVLAVIKILVGIAVGSIAIVSEGANNASDSATSLITIVGAKLSTMHPNKKHPFGFGRIEYLTSLVIAIFILVTASELFLSSFRRIFSPGELAVSYVTLIIIAVSAIVKLLLGTYSIRMGKKAGSESLIALGTDCRNDAFISAVTILSALIFLLFDVSLDAYAGIITSALIFKAGFDIMKDTVSHLLGKPASEELVAKIYEEIRSVPCILGAADLMLHNYGPDAYSGSMNLEIDHEKTIGEVYEEVHDLQLRIKHKYGIVMVFGMYAVDSDHENVKIMRKQIEKFVAGYDHITGFHALYLAPNTNEIYCDFVVDYAFHDWDSLKEEFTEYMRNLYPEYRLTVTIELNYV
ncbi:MAG: cation transporter [Clostridia bacterium]|nr:cation transporter [Clostridia bacterium]